VTGTPTDIRDFGDALIRTGDLDPVYIAIHGAQLKEPQVCRLLLAYWCFYHLGAAAWLSESQGPSYWHHMRTAAENNSQGTPTLMGLPSDRWPRGAERRHFRGQKCVQAVQWLSTHDPEAIVHHLVGQGHDRGVMHVVQGWPMFGPWIAFKAADMLERVWGAPIKFDRNIGLMYDEPRRGLDMLATDPSLITTDRSPEGLYTNLLTYFSPRPAPPSGDRGCGPQEVETILCKWKSMRGGHYWVGKDIHEVRAGLGSWGETAQRMLAACPAEVVH
jgi:Alpha-glutamyl/putrescinyl thymine pyrophosphorylase clade 2